MRYLKVSLDRAYDDGGRTQANAQASAPVEQRRCRTSQDDCWQALQHHVPGKIPALIVVKWGDQSMTWTPKPWMEDEYRSTGPAYYAQWTQPDMPAPWEVPIDQRSSLSGADLVNRCYARK